MSNSLKFTPFGGDIHVTIEEDSGYVTYSVKDSGIGMSRVKIDSLFDKGKARSLGTNNEEGTGLGLVLVNDFVTVNKGKIEVMSTEGQGTTFKVSFPRGHQSPGDLQERSEEMVKV